MPLADLTPSCLPSRASVFTDRENQSNCGTLPRRGTLQRELSVIQVPFQAVAGDENGLAILGREVFTCSEEQQDRVRAVLHKDF